MNYTEICQVQNVPFGQANKANGEKPTEANEKKRDRAGERASRAGAAVFQPDLAVANEPLGLKISRKSRPASATALESGAGFRASVGHALIEGGFAARGLGEKGACGLKAVMMKRPLK